MGPMTGRRNAKNRSKTQRNLERRGNRDHLYSKMQETSC